MPTIKETPTLSAGWLTGAEAAELAGMAPPSFRKEVQRSPELLAAKRMLGPLACYPEKTVRAWLKARPGQGRRPA